MTNTVEQAIGDSAGQNRIVHIEASDEDIEALSIACDDHVENGPVHEFWGVDDDGDSWRVHVDLPPEKERQMTQATEIIGRVGRNGIRIERFLACDDGEPYTFEGSDYGYASEAEARDAALQRDAFLSMLNKPMTEWVEALEAMTADERNNISADASTLMERSARLKGYIEGRWMYNDRDHASAVSASNKLAERIRKVLGFAYPKQVINF